MTTVDSQNLSSGYGMLVLAAAEMAEEGLSPEQICQRVELLCPRAHTSFLLDTLEFMRAGGRCSTIASFGASLLKLNAPALRWKTRTARTCTWARNTAAIWSTA